MPMPALPPNANFVSVPSMSAVVLVVVRSRSCGEEANYIPYCNVKVRNDLGRRWSFVEVYGVNVLLHNVDPSQSIGVFLPKWSLTETIVALDERLIVSVSVLRVNWKLCKYTSSILYCFMLDMAAVTVRSAQIEDINMPTSTMLIKYINT